MKRDFDLIRLILIHNETGEKPRELDAYQEDHVLYNIALMKDAGLIEAYVEDDVRGRPCAAVINRLTWAGHDFLDSIRDESIWVKAKEKVIKPMGSFTFGLLKEYLSSEIKRSLLG